MRTVLTGGLHPRCFFRRTAPLLPLGGQLLLRRKLKRLPLFQSAGSLLFSADMPEPRFAPVPGQLASRHDKNQKPAGYNVKILARLRSA